MNYKTYILIAATLLFIVQSYAVFSSQNTNFTALTAGIDTTDMLDVDKNESSAWPTAPDLQVWPQLFVPDLDSSKFTLIELCRKTMLPTVTAVPGRQNPPANDIYIHHYVAHYAMQSHPQNRQWVFLEMARITDRTNDYEASIATEGHESVVPGNSEWTFPTPGTLPMGSPIHADRTLLYDAGPAASPHHQTVSDVIHIPEGADASIIIDSESPPNACYILHLAFNTAFL